MKSARVLTPVQPSPVLDGPVPTTFTLLFRPLWPVVVPSEEWRKKAATSLYTIPDSLLDPLRIWMLDCFPERALVSHLIQAGDGNNLPDRDPLEEAQWADPLRRASEILWARGADVFSRPLPEPVLNEIAESSGLKTTTVAELVPIIHLLFSNADLLFSPRDEVAPVVPDHEKLDNLLKQATHIGMTAWSFCLTLLFVSRNEIDVVLPAARAVAYMQPDPQSWLDRCDKVLGDVFDLLEMRCSRIQMEISLISPAERKERRVLLWLEPAEQATMSALIRFANRCSLHVLVAARRKVVAAKAVWAQFTLLVEEDMLLRWPVMSWSDSRLLAFERGNRRFRKLSVLGMMFSRFSDYRSLLKKLVEHYGGEQVAGLTYVEKIHAMETLEESSVTSPLLNDYLKLLAPPARVRLG